jgi:hypothetical protein
MSIGIERWRMVGHLHQATEVSQILKLKAGQIESDFISSVPFGHYPFSQASAAVWGAFYTLYGFFM